MGEGYIGGGGTLSGAELASDPGLSGFGVRVLLKRRPHQDRP